MGQASTLLRVVSDRGSFWLSLVGADEEVVMLLTTSVVCCEVDSLALHSGEHSLKQHYSGVVHCRHNSPVHGSPWGDRYQKARKCSIQQKPPSSMKEKGWPLSATILLTRWVAASSALPLARQFQPPWEYDLLENALPWGPKHGAQSHSLRSLLFPSCWGASLQMLPQNSGGQLLALQTSQPQSRE